MAGLVTTVGGNNLSAYIEPTSISTKQIAGHQNGTARFTVEDATGTVSIASGDAVTIVDDGTTIFGGEVARIKESQAGLTQIWRVECQDYNAYLDMAIATHTFAAGTADDAIIDALFTAYRSDLDSVTDVAQLDASMEAVTFTAMTLREALDDLARRTGARYYVDYDKDLHWYATEAGTSSFSLSDTPDMAASFPFANFRRTTDGTRKISHVWVEGKEINGWHPATPDWSTDERHAIDRDQRITTAQGITDRGTAIYNRYSAALTTYEMDIWKDGLVVGDSVTLVNSLWSVNAGFYIRKIEMRVVGRDGELREYHLTLDDEPTDPIDSARNTSWQTTIIQDAIWEIDTLASRGWAHDMAFSATDHDTVAWGSGTITLAGGTGTFSIDAGNTGNIAAITYIYLDADTSATVLQTDTSAANAVGRNKILIAVCEDVAATYDAVYQVFGGAGNTALIVGDNIAAGTIVTNHLAANAVTAAKITAGTITAAEIAANTITATQIAATTITAAEIAANAITAAKLEATLVLASTITAGACTLDSGGLTLDVMATPWVSDDNVIKFDAAGNITLRIGAYPSGTYSIGAVRVVPETGDACALLLEADSGAQNPQIVIWAEESPARADIDLVGLVNCSTLLTIGGTIVNNNQTIGLTIDQGTNDNEALTLQSTTDVGHGGYQTDTNTFGALGKVQADSGGLSVDGYKDSAGVAGAAAVFRGYLDENADTTKGTTGRAIVEIAGFQTSGGSIANTVADGNVLAIRTRVGGANITTFIVDEDGDLVRLGGLQEYDSENDIALVRELSRLCSPERREITASGERTRCEALGIAYPDKHGVMVSGQRHDALIRGALLQIDERMRRIEAAL